MDFWSALLFEVEADNTGLVVLGLVLCYALVSALKPRDKPRLKPHAYMVALHVLLLPLVGYLRMTDAPFLLEVRVAVLTLAVLASVGVVHLLFFALLLPTLNIKTPRILHDVVLVAMAVLAMIALASQLGLNLTGLIATSAVLTAVIGFAFQGTLSNLIGGMAMQLDDSIAVGDWVEIDGVIGRVTQMRWRYMSLETRHWETVLVPNGRVMAGRVKVLGKRGGEAPLWRREVEFRVDFFNAPTAVIEAVDEAMRHSPLPHVAASPAPHTLLMELDESYGRYVVRYWVRDPAQEDLVGSCVRSRVYFALKRQRMRLALPSRHIFMTEAHQRQVEGVKRHELHKRTMLCELPLFESLSEQERFELAAELRYAPFAAGECILEQGEEGAFMYILTEGKCRFSVTVGDETREVACLERPAFFGEMALMTGAPSAVKVEAVTDVECYRLDNERFRGVIQARPEVAEHVSHILAARQMEVDMVVEDIEACEVHLEARRWEVLGKIQSFFGLARSTRKDEV